ncbi:MAG: PHP domain-containing protein [Actinobacteria bacterium]|nr:PHP domain-containing protein [Actinomycetota bacterium]
MRNGPSGDGPQGVRSSGRPRTATRTWTRCACSQHKPPARQVAGPGLVSLAGILAEVPPSESSSQPGPGSEPVLPADSHVHSEWSYDTGGQASMIASCQRAVDLGVPAVAFTEHLDFTDWGPGDAIAATGVKPGWWDAIRPLDVEGYLGSVADCRERFPGLRIFTGVEAGEPHLFAGSTRAVLAAGRFDRVLGSLHALGHDGRLVNASSLLRTSPPHEVMRRYFTEVLALIGGSDAFQILAHPDYPRRHWPPSAGPYREADFEDEYRAVLRALAGSGRVLEVNTYSPLLSVNVLRWWREEGGTAVSFGSDAHVSWRVGDKFSRAVEIVEAAGFARGGDPFGFWRR